MGSSRGRLNEPRRTRQRLEALGRLNGRRYWEWPGRIERIVRDEGSPQLIWPSAFLRPSSESHDPTSARSARHNSALAPHAAVPSAIASIRVLAVPTRLFAPSER